MTNTHGKTEPVGEVSKTGRKWEATLYPEGYRGPSEVLGTFKTRHEAVARATRAVQDLQTPHNWTSVTDQSGETWVLTADDIKS